MEIKDKIGWVVCEKNKKGSRAAMVQPYTDMRGATESVSGFVEVFSQKNIAQELCNELNDSWEGRPFIVRKCKASVI